MRENKDKVSKVIRALLLSAKHGLTVNELCSEYAALESKPLPYRELGYNSAIEMVKDMPEVIKPIFYGSAMILQGIADESTSHISQLVKHQRNTGHNTRITTPQQEVKVVKPVIPSFLQEKIAAVLLNYPKGVEINTFNKSYFKRHGQKLEPHRLGFKTLKEVFENCRDILSITARSSDVFIFPKPGIVSGMSNANVSNNAQKKQDLKALFNEYCSIPEQVKNEISVVLSSKPNGVWVTRFPHEYKVIHKKEINYQSLGFGSLVELMAKLPDFVMISRPNANGDFLLKPRKIPEIIPVDAAIDEHSKYSLQSPGQLNELIEIYLSYTVSPSFFWFQCVSMLEDLNELEERMGEFYHTYDVSNKYKLPKKYLKEDQICCALYEDDWYRAIIRKVSSEDEIEVFYVDYGNEGISDIHSLRLMRKEFLQLPAQAVMAELHNVQPLGKDWDQSSCDRFAELTGDGHIYAKLVLVNGDKQEIEDIIASVDLINTCEDDDVNIAEVLVQESHGQYKETMQMKVEKDAQIRKREFISSLEKFYEDYYRTLKQVSELRKEAPEKRKTSNTIPVSMENGGTVKTNKQKSPLLPTPLPQVNPESPPLLPTTISQPKKQKPPLSESGKELLLRKQIEIMVDDIKNRQTIDSRKQETILPPSPIKSRQTIDYRKSEIISPPSPERPAFEKVFKSERIIRLIHKENILHLVKWERTAMVISAEISGMIWKDDILRQMLRQKRKNVDARILLYEGNEELFRELVISGVKGLKSNENHETIKPCITLYSFESLIEIVNLFKLKTPEMKMVLQKEYEEYKDKSESYFQMQRPKEPDAAEELRLKYQALSYRRKRLYLSILMNRAQEGAIDEVQDLQKELDNLQKELKSLTT